MDDTKTHGQHSRSDAGYGAPRQTAAERRLRNFAAAVEQFHCDTSGKLFNEAFQAIAPPKIPQHSTGMDDVRCGTGTMNKVVLILSRATKTHNT
jgi:hypothetical protein